MGNRLARQPGEEVIMSETCNVCKGSLRPQHTTYTQWYEGRLIVIENVPAQVCEQCGETY
ncbi:MAG: type II toxin-antitoxin system MqsA family antitoxin, partial [Anaerolineae bacterium]|nr:type II toxin-antitoxin system MqsA family antitoxin [Anaerolineae bacterium]